MAPQMMGHVPAAVQQPAGGDGAVAPQAEEGEDGDESAEAELPHAQAAAQIGRPGAGEEDGAELLSRRSRSRDPRPTRRAATPSGAIH